MKESHFLVDVELLPHAFVNISNEKMHIGVYFIFVFIIYHIFLYSIGNSSRMSITVDEERISQFLRV
jgi:hypothetical protein